MDASSNQHAKPVSSVRLREASGCAGFAVLQERAAAVHEDAERIFREHARRELAGGRRTGAEAAARVATAEFLRAEIARRAQRNDEFAAAMHAQPSPEPR
jgi:hypothetical protein